MKVNFKELVGKTGILCAVDGYKFRIGNLTFEVIEDENDGYRSMLGTIQSVEEKLRPTFRENVTITSNPSITGYSLINDNGVSVLDFGTDRYDDWYPCFLFEWKPKLLTTLVDYDSLLNTID